MTRAASSMIKSDTPLNPRMVPSSPGSDTTREPLANSIRRADSLSASVWK